MTMILIILLILILAGYATPSVPNDIAHALVAVLVLFLILRLLGLV